ncbi:MULTISPECIES: hypothetical protein [Streptomyces]|uniref:Cysteine-rich CPCC domain-containing protein n=4 Tax=Streptomyces TaxID=1883 RepID=A0ABD5J534_9ACTN|nr:MULTISPECIES: hypothetical protein [Streptomyces]MEE4583460.1 hypothetical protein [Streptomyces sp. DSM 41602]WJD96640.1 hypothetical protein QR300_11965 [Streptomyces antimycoticus]WTA84620.1 hypothetical protein OG751_34720 [Streptomyces antimycoticus]WTB04940.1 hypothetical protein OG546_12395 [Streptomyces antimycoticus]
MDERGAMDDRGVMDNRQVVDDRPVHDDRKDLPEGPPYADCVLCGEPTEHPATRPGATLCPVCEWQEAQRTACSG